MRIIITGASGFIGKNILLGMPSNWEVISVYNKSKDFLTFVDYNNLNHVIPVKCNLTKKNDVNKMFIGQRNDFDVCIYLLANTFVPKAIKDPQFDLTVNTLALLNFLDFYKGKKFIYFSSDVIYDGLKGLVNPGTKISPRNPYGISKLTSEYYVRFHQHDRKNFNEYIILRLFGAYGQYEPPRKLFTKLVESFYFDDKNEFTLFGNGKNYYNAMHVEDVVKGTLDVIKSDKGNLTVDFAKGNPVNINELVRIVARTFGKEDIRINHTGIAPEYLTFYASGDQMKALFGFESKISLVDGIKKHAKWLEFERKKRTKMQMLDAIR